MFLDVCHMLKLLRGAFTSVLMKTEDGRLINWDFVKALNALQEKEGLRLANKLKTSHILWKNQKMNVKLAAQVFSAGVANAIEYCDRVLKLPQFVGSEATVEFIRHVDASFDVLNSRNPLGKKVSFVFIFLTLSLHVGYLNNSLKKLPQPLTNPYTGYLESFKMW